MHISLFLSVYLLIDPSIHLPTYISIFHLPMCLSAYLSVCLSMYISTYLPTCVPIGSRLGAWYHHPRLPGGVELAGQRNQSKT